MPAFRVDKVSAGRTKCKSPMLKRTWGNSLMKASLSNYQFAYFFSPLGETRNPDYIEECEDIWTPYLYSQIQGIAIKEYSKRHFKKLDYFRREDSF